MEPLCLHGHEFRITLDNVTNPIFQYDLDDLTGNIEISELPFVPNLRCRCHFLRGNSTAPRQHMTVECRSCARGYIYHSLMTLLLLTKPIVLVFTGSGIQSRRQSYSGYKNKQPQAVEGRKRRSPSPLAAQSLPSSI